MSQSLSTINISGNVGRERDPNKLHMGTLCPFDQLHECIIIIVICDTPRLMEERKPPSSGYRTLRKRHHHHYRYCQHSRDTHSPVHTHGVRASTVTPTIRK